MFVFQLPLKKKHSIKKLILANNSQQCLEQNEIQLACHKILFLWFFFFLMKFGKYQRAIFRPSSPDSTRITDKKKKKEKRKKKKKTKTAKNMDFDHNFRRQNWKSNTGLRKHTKDYFKLKLSPASRHCPRWLISMKNLFYQNNCQETLNVGGGLN